MQEEGTELAQSAGISREDAHKNVDMVYDKPVGEIGQEIAGYGDTLPIP